NSSVAARAARRPADPPHGAQSAPWGPPLERRDDRAYRQYVRSSNAASPGLPNAAAALGWRRDASAAECCHIYEMGHLGKPWPCARPQGESKLSPPGSPVVFGAGALNDSFVHQDTIAITACLSL